MDECTHKIDLFRLHEGVYVPTQSCSERSYQKNKLMCTHGHEY